MKYSATNPNKIFVRLLTNLLHMKMPESTTEPSIIAPDDAIKLTEDGGVSKLVVREGNGDIPPLHSRCIGMHDHICIFLVVSRSCTSNV